MMFRSTIHIIALCACFLLLVRCTSESPAPANDPSGFGGSKVPKYDINTADNTPGLQGVFDVPEMLSLCRLDSGSSANIASKVVEGYNLIEQEMNLIGTSAGGPQGMIYYSTDPGNFKFETVRLISNMPTKTPKTCQIVVLEASYMLVYNYIGPYEDTYKVYEVIRKYMNDNYLEQTGPTREFYPPAPPDAEPSQLLTRILVPVKKAKLELNK